MNKKIKHKIEDLTFSEVGDLIEIKGVFRKYSDVIIDDTWSLSKDGEQLRKLDIAYHCANNPEIEYRDMSHIIGINPGFDPQTKDFEFYTVSTNDLNILLSLISLVNEPIDVNNLSAAFSNKDIINWCKTHTLPSVKKHEKWKMCDTDKYTFLYDSMPLDIFYHEAITIYLIFKICGLLNEDDFTKAKEYATKLKDLTLENGKEEIENNIDINIIISTIIDYKIKNVHLRFLNFATNKLFLDADDLFSMIYFQLANLITKPIEERQKHIILCINCGKAFWGHGNRKYCYDCDRRTVFSRKQRANKEGK